MKFSYYFVDIKAESEIKAVKFNMTKKCIILAVLLIFVLTAYSWADDTTGAAKPFSSKKPFAAGEVVVKFRNVPANVPAAQPAGNSMGIASSGKTNIPPKVKKLFKRNNRNIGQGMSISSAGGDRIDEPGVYKLTYEGRDDIYTVIEQLRNNPDVEYAEPNYIYQTSVVPNDPNYELEWGFDKIGAPAAWDVTKGRSDVIIAVIDTGVDYNHQDLAPNIWSNTREVADNGIDDDGNGYVDDTRGWDFVSVAPDWVITGEDGGPPDNDPMDFLGHGTHVSGIAAGLPNNKIGIAGAAWNCSIMPLRAGYMAYDGGGYLEMTDIAEALYYAADNGANVINMSFGSLYDSKCLRDAVNYAHRKGCVMVASAGNVDSYDAGKPFYPAAYENVIAVSAVDIDDKISIWGFFAFSNFGDFVDLSAPGTSILSTLPGNQYGYASGTSMASPFVAGTAALVKSKHKDWTPEQIETRIKQTSDDIIYTLNPQSFLVGKLGSGRVNAKKALGNLSMAITYPKPSSVLSGSVVIKGDADMENFSGYKVEYSTGSTPEAWNTIAESTDKSVIHGVLGVWNVDNPERNYNLRLTVSNSSGESYQYVTGVNFGTYGEVKLDGKPKCGPSPFDPEKDEFIFYYDLLSASDVDIYVYDTSGTLVWQKNLDYDSGTIGHGGSAGPNRVYWDGVNGFGESLGNGAYLYMIVANDGRVRKVIGRGKFAVVRG